MKEVMVDYAVRPEPKRTSSKGRGTMKKHWLLIASAVLSAVLAAAAVACSDNNGDGGGTGTPAENTPAEGAAPATESQPVVVTLNEDGGSGVSGTATLIQTGQGLEVGISVSGLSLTPGTYQAHIHPYPAGATCASVDRTQPITVTDLDVTAIALPDLVVDGSGKAEAAATIPSTGVTGLNGAPVGSTLAYLQDSNNNYHVEVYDFSKGIVTLACGDIPGAS